MICVCLLLATEVNAVVVSPGNGAAAGSPGELEHLRKRVSTLEAAIARDKPKPRLRESGAKRRRKAAVAVPRPGSSGRAVASQAKETELEKWLRLRGSSRPLGKDADRKRPPSEPAAKKPSRSKASKRRKASRSTSTGAPQKNPVRTAAKSSEPLAPPAPKPEPKPAPKPEPKPEPKPAPKPEPKPEPRPEPKPEPKPEPAPEPRRAQEGSAPSPPRATREEDRPDSRDERNREVREQLSEAIPVRQGGVLLPAGRLMIEPEFRYSYTGVNRVAISGYTILPALTLGLIDVTTHNKTSMLGTVAFRYGFNHRIELDAAASFVSGWSSFSLSAKNTVEDRSSTLNASGYGIGDLRFGLRTQLNQGTASLATFVAGVGVRIPTGTSPYEVKRHGVEENYIETDVPTGSGFFSVSPTLSFVYPTEPGVIYGSLHYSWNIPRTINTVQPGTNESYGEIDPGDVIGGSFGMGLSLNQKLSLNLNYDHSIVLKTKQKGIVAPDAVPLQIGTLGIGVTSRRNAKISYNFLVAIGVTDDAPDVSLTMRIPVNWDIQLNAFGR